MLQKYTIVSTQPNLFIRNYWHFSNNKIWYSLL